MPDSDLRGAIEIGSDHVRKLSRASGRDIAEATFFEFGAGCDLHMPLVLWALGVERQIVVDIRPLVRADLLTDVARRLATSAQVPEFVRLPSVPLDGQVELGSYLDALGIDYRAPCDARATGLPDGSVDFVTSTNTLEHIPPDEIRAILREVRRILADDGLMSFQIDYQDHYSYFDPDVSAYNFLTFDERSWRRWNPSLHFQNRLRHRDHLALLDGAGFEVLENTPSAGAESDLDVLRALPLAPQFKGVPIGELAIRGSRFVLAKRPSPGDNRG